MTDCDCKRIKLINYYNYILFQVSETENIRKNLAIERMIVEGCDILLDVNQMFVRQGKKPTTSSSLSSCFPKEAVPSFPRRSIDFPRRNTDLFTSEDGEEQTPRSQRSHSTVSYMSREQQLAALGGRRRLSSLRQSSLGNAVIGGAVVAAAGSCGSGVIPLTTTGTIGSPASSPPITTSATISTVVTTSSTTKHGVNINTTPLSPSQTTSTSDRRGSDVPRVRKKSVRISDDSFDECEELVASGAPRPTASVFSPDGTPSSSPDAADVGAVHHWNRPDLAPVQERTSVDSGNSEDPPSRPPSEAPS